MRHLSRVILMSLMLALTAGNAATKPNENLAAFHEARFGMFIHWGLYSLLGGRWKGQSMDYIGEWIQSRYRTLGRLIFRWANGRCGSARSRQGRLRVSST